MFEIEKRNKEIVNFNEGKIENAIYNAFMDKEFIIDGKHKYKKNIKENTEEITRRVIRRINREYNQNDVISVEDIQDIVEDVLMKSRFKDVAKSYIQYRERKTLARDKFFENQHKFIKTIENITFEESEDNDLKRENANVDGNSAMGTMLQYGSTLSKEFAITHLLDEKHSMAHDKGDIHIHDLDFYSMGTATCLSRDTLITIQDSKGIVSTVNIDYFDEMMKNNRVNLKEYHILSRDGWTKIKNVVRRKIEKNEKMYEIQTRKSLRIKATENHKIPVIRGGKEELLFVKNIKKDDLLIRPSYEYTSDDDIIDVIELLKDVDDLIIVNIRKLKQFLNYKYDISNLYKYINSNTSKRGNEYLTMQDFYKLKEELYIPEEVLLNLRIRAKHSKKSLPLNLPITPELARFVGYLMSDGSVYTNKENGTYHFTITNTNKEINKDVEHCIETVFNDTPSFRIDDGEEYGRTLCGKVYYHLINSLNIKVNSFKMKVPDFIVNGNEEIKVNFIKALYDGDGNISNDRITYSTVSKELANQLVLILQSLNIESSIQLRKTKNQTDIYNGVNFVRNGDINIVNILTKDSMSRFREVIGQLLKQTINPDYSYSINSNRVIPTEVKYIREIEYVDYVYDIETSNHWFVANGIIVHNCTQIDLNRLFTDGFSTGHGFLREPQSIESYSSLACIAIQANQNEQHGGQSINAFDYYLAPGVLKSFKKYLKQYIEDFLLYDNNIEDSLLLNKVFEHIDNNVNTINLKGVLMNSIATVIMTELSITGEDAIRVSNKAYERALEMTNRSTFQAMESLVHNLNTMNSRAGSQVPFSSINFGTDTSLEGRMVSKNLLLAMDAGLGRGETAIFPILIFKVKEGINYNPEDKNYDLFKLAMKVSAKRLFPNFSFLDAPFNLEYYEEGNYHSEVSYMGCRTRVMSNEVGSEQSSSRGNLSFTSINLPRLGIKHGLKEEINMKEFYEDLEKNIELIKEQLLERFEYQGNKKVKNSPFLMGQGIWLDSENLNPNDTLYEVLKHGTLSVGFIGLAECLVALTGKHHGESEESQKLGLEIIGFIRNKLDEYSKDYNLNFSLIGTPAEGLSGRFVKIDKGIYGEIEGVTDREYYTNSFHVPVYYDINAFNKVKIEAPYHNLTNAGHITYVELDGDPLQNLEAFEKVVRLMKESGIGYGSINHPVDRDPICGHTGIIGDTCPSCGREEDNTQFERIRRITGYLVGTLDRFNDSKQAEERDRIKHM